MDDGQPTGYELIIYIYIVIDLLAWAADGLPNNFAAVHQGELLGSRLRRALRSSGARGRKRDQRRHLGGTVAESRRGRAHLRMLLVLAWGLSCVSVR